jgi:hypothetical protein
MGARMSDFMKEAANWATMPIPGAETPEEQAKLFDAMPMAELADTWRALQQVGLRDKTDGTWATFHYFDSLPHQQPDRALDLILEILKRETDTAVLIQLGDKFTPALMIAHGATLIDRLEREAVDNPRLRWLLGSVIWWTEDDALEQRLSAISDKDGWWATHETHEQRNPKIDFARLSPAEIAQVWIAQNGCAEKDRDRNWSALRDYESDLRGEDPERALAIILEVLKAEPNQNMLGYLAAGPLEDLITLDTIDMIEVEAERNERFRWLLGGVWYYTAPDELKARLDAIIKGQHW